MSASATQGGRKNTENKMISIKSLSAAQPGIKSHDNARNNVHDYSNLSML